MRYINYIILGFGILFLSIQNSFASCTPKSGFSCTDNGDGTITYSSELKTETGRPVETETFRIETPPAVRDESTTPGDNGSTMDPSLIGTTGQNGSTAGNTQEQTKIPTDTSTDNILGISNNDLRTGNVDMNTIPTVLVNIINVLLGIAGTVSVVSLIYYAVQMQINSGITGDSSGVDKAKRGMYGSVIGFVVAILAWFIVIRFIEILSGLS